MAARDDAPLYSVVLTAFERSEALRNALLAWRRQTVRDFEVVVADDGSGPGVERVVRELEVDSPYPLSFVRHERRGHRRAATINMGVAASRGRRIFFTDGDCLPAHDLLEQHDAAHEPRRMLMGGRVSLDAGTTAQIDGSWIQRGAYEGKLTPAIRRSLFRKHLKNMWHIGIRKRRRPHNFGLNMSLERRDFLSVNGYDERFSGWGSADGDLRERLKMVGVWPKSIWHRAVTFHQHHAVDATRAMKVVNAAYARRSGVHPWVDCGFMERTVSGSEMR